MVRKRRLHQPGAYFHVTLRGNGRKTIFYNDKNRSRFCLFLQEAIEKYDHKIHAFCLMGNHIHLLIQASERTISKSLHVIAGRYSKYLNKYTNSVGHQFQGRFFGSLIENDDYLKQVVKYIHLNPVQASMVTCPENYYWSSHNCYLGKDEIPWLNTDFILNVFSENSSQAISQYRIFMGEVSDTEVVEQIEKPKGGGRIIGSDDFVKEVLQDELLMNPSNQITINDLLVRVSEELSIPVGQIYSKSKGKKSAHARAILAFFVNEIETLKLTELARLTGKSAPTLSKQSQRISKIYKTDQEVTRTILNIRLKLGLGLIS